MPDISMMSASPDPALVEVMRQIRADARSDPKPAEVAVPVSIAFTFRGSAGQLPTVGDTFTLPVGRLAANITSATISADGIATASIDLALGTVSSWPQATLIYDVIPSINGAPAVDIDTSGWHMTNIQPEDILAATLRTASGSFTSITLTVTCVRLRYASGSSSVTAIGGSPIVTIGGSPVDQRSAATP